MQTPPLRPRLRTASLGLLAALLLPASAEARPSGPTRFCQAYPDSPDCLGRYTTCATCHTSTDPAGWNSYGLALLAALDGRDFDSALTEAMASIEDADSDSDGVSNLDEILLGTEPGNAESLWQPAPEPVGEANPWYALGRYDAVVAYRRAMVLYCGHSPDYEEIAALRELADEDQRDVIHEALALCLDGRYWREIGLRELADPRIKPIFAIGAQTEVYLDEFRLVLADYEWDYRLWRYLLTDDRDMRELLTAQYHVEADGAGGLVPVDGAIPNPYIDNGVAGGQPLEPEHRAGMLTTQWFLMSNTMFSALPRTTAAQAYRAYLGMDISKHEGIVGVPGEPLDVDHKGVAAPACAQCHATLDPLSYAFATYHGIDFPFGNGLYDPERPILAIPDWDPALQQSVVLGEPVANVVEWGRAASQSVHFRRAMTTMFIEHALGRPALPDEFEELAALVDTLPGDGYSANRLIHRIVASDAFGAP